MDFLIKRPLRTVTLLVLLGLVLTACGGGPGSESKLSESVAAGMLRAKLGRENPGSAVHCEVIDFQDNTRLWTVRCSLTSAQGKRWSDWSVDDRSGEITELPGGEPGFPTKRAE